MISFLSTIGAESDFEKNRLVLTRVNLEAPNQQCLKDILITFAGQDQQTRAQIAFATILKKINNSKQKQNWLYLLKNLIILDRVISDNRFCEQMNQVKLPTIQNFIQKNPKYRLIKSQKLLKNYWNLIKSLCIQKSSEKHILHYKRCQRKAFINNLQPREILKEIETLQKNFNDIHDLIYITCGLDSENQENLRRTQIFVEKIHKNDEQFIKSNLAGYLTINFYSKLLTIFSCQYILIYKFIQTIILTTENQQNINVVEVMHFKKIVLRFKLTCNGMILLAQLNQFKKGFQHIQINDFSSFSEKPIIKVIDEYLSQHNCQNTVIFQNTKIEPLATYRSQNIDFFMKVEKKPLFSNRNTVKSQIRQRKQIQKQVTQSDDVFSHYFNSYSTDFPHKKMMTIDLLEDIRKTQLQNITISQKSIQDTCPQSDFQSQFSSIKFKTKINDFLSFCKKQGSIQNQEASTNQNEDFGKKSCIQRESSLNKLIYVNEFTRHTSII